MHDLRPSVVAERDGIGLGVGLVEPGETSNHHHETRGVIFCLAVVDQDLEG